MGEVRPGNEFLLHCICTLGAWGMRRRFSNRRALNGRRNSTTCIMVQYFMHTPHVIHKLYPPTYPTPPHNTYTPHPPHSSTHTHTHTPHSSTHTHTHPTPPHHTHHTLDLVEVLWCVLVAHVCWTDVQFEVWTKILKIVVVW